MHQSEIDWSGIKSSWRFQRGRDAVAPTEIQGSNFLIAVSMRNPQFSNDWIEEALECIQAWRGKALLTLVDLPYLASIEVLSATPTEKTESLRIYERQRLEQATRLSRISTQHEDVCDYWSWSTLLSITPSALLPELEQAFFTKKKVYSLVIDQVKRVFDNVEDLTTLEGLAKFFLHEVPTLIHIYYSLVPGCIDIYPGQQADFFWELDRQNLSDELPMASRLAMAGPSHTYAVVKLR